MKDNIEVLELTEVRFDAYHTATSSPHLVKSHTSINQIKSRRKFCECQMVECDCDAINNHSPHCAYRRAKTCPVGFPCDAHELEVCPLCDKCDCK